jgi:dienelactone hydrolase
MTDAFIAVLPMKSRPLLLIIACVAAVFSTAPAGVRAQSGVQGRWFHVLGDSVRVEYALPRTTFPRPAVVVLCDRFGMQKAVASIVAIFAHEGFRAFAIPLRSAPTRAPEGIPPVAFDSTDVDVVAQIVVDILNDRGCTGTAGLFAFDVGATIGAMAERRFPLFAACVLFYPFDATRMQALLPAIATPVTLHVAEYDADCSLARINAIRDTLIDAGRKVRVLFQKSAGPFFFDPGHENYNKTLTNAAWNDALKEFRARLR